MEDKKLIRTIATFVLALFTLVVVALLFIEIPKQNQRVLDILLGALVGFAGAIVTFYFGSSLGSKMKDKTNEINETE